MTGAITVAAPLDFERSHTHVLSVKASDSLSASSNIAQTKVNVRVTDANDNPPTISVTLLGEGQVAQVPEDAPPGNVLFCTPCYTSYIVVFVI